MNHSVRWVDGWVGGLSRFYMSTLCRKLVFHFQTDCLQTLYMSSPPSVEVQDILLVCNHGNTPVLSPLELGTFYVQISIFTYTKCV